jgi:hypothetical protein
MIFAHKFGPWTLMGLNGNNGRDQDVSSLTRRGNEISCLADWNLNALIILSSMNLCCKD